MNHDVPETLDAVRSRTAELEQQLRLSDEGVSRLAQRCLELEQQVITCEDEVVERHPVPENYGLILPHLFYDTGHGFCQEQCLAVSKKSYDEMNQEITACFTVPEDSRSLRLDPGEIPCCLTDFIVSDERISCQPLESGLLLQEDCLLFTADDPKLLLLSPAPFVKGTKFAVTYHYYPLEQLQNEQPESSILDGLYASQKKRMEEADAAAEALQESQKALDDSRADCAALKEELEGQIAELEKQLVEVQAKQIEYQTSLETVLASTSWRLTAPLRALWGLFSGH